jgi:hypothetical protein
MPQLYVVAVQELLGLLSFLVTPTLKLEAVDYMAIGAYDEHPVILHGTSPEVSRFTAFAASILRRSLSLTPLPMSTISYKVRIRSALPTGDIRAERGRPLRRLTSAAAIPANWSIYPSASLSRPVEPSSATHLDLDQGEAVRLALVLLQPTL